MRAIRERTGAKCVGPKESGAATRIRPRRSPEGRVASLATSNSLQIFAACSRNVAPASVKEAPRVVRASSWTPRNCSSRASRLLTSDLETPSRRAACVRPEASATSTKVRSSSISIVVSFLATRCGVLMAYRSRNYNGTAYPDIVTKGLLFRPVAPSTTAYEEIHDLSRRSRPASSSIARMGDAPAAA